MPTFRNLIEIVPYDPIWPMQFAAEASRLLRALGALALRIEHNGSTSVPGLAAKPIIDIQVSVEKLQPISSYGETLAAMGYVHLPHPDDSFCPFFHRPHQWPHSYHVHVVARGGLEERRTLAFRDYLREHGDEASQYEALKRSIAAQLQASNAASREPYVQAKTRFVERIVAIAFKNGCPKGE
jgi:GrpB-like predicted nucleotidyltransferase (UPF0157 family)